MNDARLAEGLVERLVDLSLVLRNDPGAYTHYPRNGASPFIVDLTCYTPHTVQPRAITRRSNSEQETMIHNTIAIR